MSHLFSNGSRAALVLAIAGLATTGLAGCGGSSSAGASAGTSTPAASTPAASSAGGGSTGKVTFTDAEACAWLKEELVAVKKIDDPTSVQLNILGSLSNFFDEHGGLANAGSSGYDADAATARACPTEHAAILKKADLKSLGNL